MGVDIMYEDLQSATTGTLVGTGGYSGSGAVATEKSSSNWTARFRMHKDFLP